MRAPTISALRSFFNGRGKVKLVLMDYRMGLYFSAVTRLVVVNNGLQIDWVDTDLD